MGGDLEYRYEDRSVFDLTLPASDAQGDRPGSGEQSDVV